MAVVQTSPDAPAAVTASPRASWRELCVYSYNAELRCTTRSVYGFRMECSCGERGPKRQTVHAVRADVRQHEAEHVA